MARTSFKKSHEDIAMALEAATALLVGHLADRRDLSLTSAAVLSALGQHGPARLAALAATAGVSQPSMTQLVQRLERHGLATRVNDPADGRGILVGITDAGRELLADLRRSRHSRLAELMTTVSAEDEATLARAMHAALPVLRRLGDNAARLGPTLSPRPSNLSGQEPTGPRCRPRRDPGAGRGRRAAR